MTFGGQITDEVRADGFFHLALVGNGDPSHDLAHPGFLRKTIFTLSLQEGTCYSKAKSLQPSMAL